MRVIINADDFGCNYNTNIAIIDAFNKGLCTTTTIMSNMLGFEEACSLAHDNKLNSGKIGVHLVLTEGKPITNEIRKCNKFCDKNGEFLSEINRKRQITKFSLNTHEKFILAQEFRAQMESCIKNKLAINHLDSHQHVHFESGILEVILPIANEYSIKRIRIIRNCGKLNTSYQLLKTVYKYFMNKKLRNLGYARTNYFGSMDDYIYSKEILKTEENTSIEIMIHPRYMENRLVDSDGKLLESKFFQAGLIKTNTHKLNLLQGL